MRLVDEAIGIIRAHWRDIDDRPSERDLKAFDDLQEKLFHAHGAARRIAIRMQRRFHGEPEVDAAKWRR
ncbi:hypothetical protein [Microvirga sp. 2TAF3]|uniref:hypothetical protein n=1 Tax=Microvirga sp. 2TAF3 TaxID=3233014 RepID=UPI003F98CA3A